MICTTCTNKCTCPQIAVAPAVIAQPGPPTNLTADLTVIPAGSASSVQISGTPPNQHLQFLLAAGASPVFDPNVPVTTLSAGSPATASIDKTLPLTPVLSLGLPQGAAGANGKSPWTTLTGSFVMPAIGSVVTVTVGDTSFMELGAWVGVQGAGTFSPFCGWMVVAGLINGTQVFLRNPGTSDGAPSSGVPGNVTAGTTITGTGALNQVFASGRMGPAGASGAAATPLVVPLVTTVPVSAPVSPAGNLVLYSNVAPPSVPTTMRFYSWDGAAWQGSTNMVGTPGSQTFFQTADPNLSPPSPSNIGDVVWRTQGTTLTYYQRTGVSTWTVQGTFALEGTVAEFDTITSAGTVTLDAATFYHVLDTNKDIDLDFDTTNYSGAGNWTVLVYNSDAGSIDFDQGSLQANPSITFPVAVGAGETAVVKVSRSTTDGATLDTYSIDTVYVQS